MVNVASIASVLSIAFIEARHCRRVFGEVLCAGECTAPAQQRPILVVGSVDGEAVNGISEQWRWVARGWPLLDPVVQICSVERVQHGPRGLLRNSAAQILKKAERDRVIMVPTPFINDAKALPFCAGQMVVHTTKDHYAVYGHSNYAARRLIPAAGGGCASTGGTGSSKEYC